MLTYCFSYQIPFLPVSLLPLRLVSIQREISRSRRPLETNKRWTCIRVKRKEMTKIEIKIDRIPENKNIN